jgi:predicted RNA-binding Zn-ribbon protein involved in translation (DUF1610 family)
VTQSYRQNNDHKPGTWKGLLTPEGRKASFTCPKCGQLGSLADHNIAPDGTVSPSVVCPTAGCDFHEFIRLEGWTP